MKKIYVVMLTAIAMCLGPGGANAGKGPPALKKKVLRKIGLNDAQIKQIDDLTYQADGKMIDIKHDVQKARLELRRLMDSDKPSKSAVFSQIEKISALQVKQKKNRIGLMLDIRALLKPEQWEKLQMFQAMRRHERRERRRHRRMGRGMGGGPGGGMGGGSGGPPPGAPFGPDIPDAPDAP